MQMQRKLVGIVALMAICLHAMGQEETAENSGPSHLVSKRSRPVMRDKLSAEDYRKLTISGHIVVVDFYASWCGPCKLMEPVLNELSEEQKGRIEVVRINVDDNKDLMQSMAIWEIPVVKIYKDGIEEWSRVGYTDKRVITKKLRKL
jgi:thioredoxin